MAVGVSQRTVPPGMPGLAGLDAAVEEVEPLGDGPGPQGLSVFLAG